MVLAAVGDALGYRRGRWEFLKDGPMIHKQFQKMGGFQGLKISNHKEWPVSDDTVMHLATAEALTDDRSLKLTEFKDRITFMTEKYIDCMRDMKGRAPGLKCMSSLSTLNGCADKWDQMRYDNAGGGCGGSMRAMAIGLRYAGPENREDLIRYSVESGRITHNHVNGFMGAVISAAFTAYAIEDVPVHKWGHLLLNELIPQTMHYLQQCQRDWELIQRDMKKLEAKFLDYITERGIADGNSEPVFPEKYGVKERDQFYKKWSYSGWAGSSGDDSVIIAYDALLGAKNNWETLVERGVLHYGDNDSTGSICCAWYGAAYGYPDGTKYRNNWENVEYESRLKKQAQLLYDLYSKKNEIKQ